jgi:hypothetical protein
VPRLPMLRPGNWSPAAATASPTDWDAHADLEVITLVDPSVPTMYHAPLSRYDWAALADGERNDAALLESASCCSSDFKRLFCGRAVIGVCAQAGQRASSGIVGYRPGIIQAPSLRDGRRWSATVSRGRLDAGPVGPDSNFFAFSGRSLSAPGNSIVTVTRLQAPISPRPRSAGTVTLPATQPGSAFCFPAPRESPCPGRILNRPFRLR